MAVRSSRRELEIVGAIAEALNSSPTVQEALDRTLALVTNLLGLQTGWVWLVDPDTGHIYRAAARNLPPYLQEPSRLSGEAWCLCIGGVRGGALAPRQNRLIPIRPPPPAPKPEERQELTRARAAHA